MYLIMYVFNSIGVALQNEPIAFITLLFTVVLGFLNYHLTKNTAVEERKLNKEISLLKYYDKKLNSLQKINLIYKENERNLQDLIYAVKLNYEYGYPLGEGLNKTYFNELIEVFKDKEYIFDFDIIELFNKQVETYDENLATRYESEENSKIAEENKDFYFYDFDSNHLFYNEVRKKLTFILKNLNKVRQQNLTVNNSKFIYSLMTTHVECVVLLEAVRA